MASVAASDDIVDHVVVVKVNGLWPFQGTVTWLPAAQGGRQSGPPVPALAYDYAHTACVPPATFEGGLASFALRNFQSGAWTSTAQGRWLIVDNVGDQLVRPGTVVVCTEGPRTVAYFHVESVVAGLEHNSEGPRTR
jgi:hypothetical protein